MSDNQGLLRADSTSNEEDPYKSRKIDTSNILVDVCAFILVTEFCERLAYYGLVGSLTIYFHKNLGLSTLMSTEVNSLFSSVNYLTPLLGAYVADTYLGRYKTIRAFCVIYLVGISLCVFSAYPGVDMSWLFIAALFGGVALGSGGIKPCVVTLGADQFDPNDPDQVRQKESFFNWFYWAINIGATFSYTVLPNMATDGMGEIPEKYGFFFSFLIPCVTFYLAYVAFLSGSSKYIKFKPQGSALSVFFGILGQAGKKDRTGSLVLTGAFLQVPAIAIVIAGYFITDDTLQQVCAVSGMVLIVIGMLLMIVYGQHNSWLVGAETAHGGSYTAQEVSDAKEVVRLLPYMSFIVGFWAIYGQMNNNFIEQGCQCDLRVGSITLSAATLSVFDSSVILVFIPIFDKIVYPAFAKAGYPLSLMQKLGGGFIFCALSMVVAGFVEIERRNSGLLDINSNCASSGEWLPMSNFSIWWQAPQYLLIGIGEIMTSISSYELFYSQVPESMRSVCQGLNLLTTTLGFMITGAVNSIFAKWLPGNLNDGHLEYVFFFMAICMVINLFGYIKVSQGFEYKVMGADGNVSVVSVDSEAPSVSVASASGKSAAAAAVQESSAQA